MWVVMWVPIEHYVRVSSGYDARFTLKKKTDKTKKKKEGEPDI